MRTVEQGAAAGRVRRRSGPAHQRVRQVPAQLPLDFDMGLIASGRHSLAFNKPPSRDSRVPSPGEQFHRSDVASAVLAFHLAFGLPRQAMPNVDEVTRELADLRVRLQREETEELAEAAERRDLVAIADALADLVYVAYGSAITYGIDLDAVLSEVHRSNMSKLDADGRPLLREDGKVLKSRWYSPPDVQGVLTQQLPLPLPW